MEAKVLELVFPADTNRTGANFGCTLVARMEQVDQELEKGVLGER